ncbi:MAG: 16S rRNA (cytosine(967)-C(5))-methyltransferase RsmB, partial [Desulfuromonas sp.]
MSQPSARQIAYSVLQRVDEGAFADLALDAALQQARGLDPRERGLATELVYGTLRQRGRLDFALARFCRQPLAKVEPRVLTLLRLGAYQLLLLDRVPARAAVHETVELAKRLRLERATGFINGILRALLRGEQSIPWPDPQSQPAAALQHLYSLPPWLAKRWRRQWGDAGALAYAEAMQQAPPFTLRVNRLRIEREAFLQALNDAGHQAEATTYAPEGVVLLRRGEAPLPGSDAGWFQVQDEASMLIAHLLAPQKGEQILDGCAAPGGKTTHLAALSENTATITALELHSQRVELIDQGVARLGCRGITSHCWDFTSAPPFVAAASCDAILVDAPCSGLGVLRRNPEIRWRRDAGQIREMVVRQKEILAAAATCLRPGGRLLYSICTQTPEEAEGQIA